MQCLETCKIRHPTRTNFSSCIIQYVLMRFIFCNWQCWRYKLCWWQHSIHARNFPYTRKFSNKVLEKLKCAPRKIFEWFFNNAMKANPDKCHFLSVLDTNTKISVSSFDIENTHSQKFLGATIDLELNFHDHVSNLC